MVVLLNNIDWKVSSGDIKLFHSFVLKLRPHSHLIPIGVILPVEDYSPNNVNVDNLWEFWRFEQKIYDENKKS